MSSIRLPFGHTNNLNRLRAALGTDPPPVEHGVRFTLETERQAWEIVTSYVSSTMFDSAINPPFLQVTLIGVSLSAEDVHRLCTPPVREAAPQVLFVQVERRERFRVDLTEVAYMPAQGQRRQPLHSRGWVVTFLVRHRVAEFVRMMFENPLSGH